MSIGEKDQVIELQLEEIDETIKWDPETRATYGSITRNVTESGSGVRVGTLVITYYFNSGSPYTFDIAYGSASASHAIVNTAAYSSGTASITSQQLQRISFYLSARRNSTNALLSGTGYIYFSGSTVQITSTEI